MTSTFLFFKRSKFFYLAILICILFFALYSTLSIVRHLHYESYGYDLGINDQTVWRYSRFESPVSTIAPYPDKPKLAFHVELVYAFISPFYWIWPTRKMLLLISAFVLCSGGLAVYLLSKRKLKDEFISIAVTLSYLMFFGVQFAVWFDVHSSSFAAAFLTWFIYLLDKGKMRWALVFFILAITSKENIAVYTFVITLLYLIRRRDKILYFFSIVSVLYLLFVFYIFFPHIMQVKYLYQNQQGLFSNLNIFDLFNTKEKVTTIFYSFAGFGFFPLLNPLTLPLIFTHFTTYFVLASDLPGAQGLYGHYRVTLAPLFAWSTIITIATFKFINKKVAAIYLIFCVLAVQYFLHLPLSYLTKNWFWKEPEAVNSINSVIAGYLPGNASVVSQNNITPHISHRDKIYTLYPQEKTFKTNSPCGKSVCDWFIWYDNPEFLIVDTSENWDARHLLTDRKKFVKGLDNMQKAGIIKKTVQKKNTILYKITKSR